MDNRHPSDKPAPRKTVYLELLWSTICDGLICLTQNLEVSNLGPNLEVEIDKVGWDMIVVNSFEKFKEVNSRY